MHYHERIPQLCQLAVLACVVLNNDEKEAGYYKPDATSIVKDTFCKSMQHPVAVASQSCSFSSAFAGLLGRMKRNHQYQTCLIFTGYWGGSNLIRGTKIILAVLLRWLQTWLSVGLSTV